MQRTFVLIKPDAMNRGLVGKVVCRLEEKGLKLVGMKMMGLDGELLKAHYAHLADKPFFPRLCEFMQKTPVIATVWEGKDAVEVVRKISGTTNGREALPGTIRGDYSMSISTNIVHASDSEAAAKEEIERFFGESELFSWERAVFEFMYASDEI